MPRVPVFIEEEVMIPEWVVDLDSFRHWARSAQFPSSGWYSFIDGTLWVDRTMEQLFSHNRVKGQYSTVLNMLTMAAKSGYFFFDRTLLSHPGANLSTEPDGLFVAYESLRAGRIQLIQGAKEGFVELEGTADMTLEIVSDSSVQKDTVVLKEKYALAGVPEYWLVDARGDQPIFEIWQLIDGAYQAVPSGDGWLASAVFGKSFKLEQEKDPLGHPLYRLLVR
ncbi:MAG: Uma2 family endonuclease [Planctomycetes bacterium]|nr:Uma2 family endonuclease [Planctomycetota bacterium]